MNPRIHMVIHGTILCPKMLSTVVCTLVDSIYISIFGYVQCWSTFCTKFTMKDQYIFLLRVPTTSWGGLNSVLSQEKFFDLSRRVNIYGTFYMATLILVIKSTVNHLV